MPLRTLHSLAYPPGDALVTIAARTHASHPLAASSLIAIIITLAIMLTGCASTPTAINPTSRTGGMELEVYARKDQFSFARYRVTQDGMIHYAGAADAQQREFTWSGRIPDDDLAELQRLLELHDWWTWQPDRTDQSANDQARYEIRLAGPRAAQHFVVHGRPQRLTAVVDLLEQLASARHESFLRTLPRPSHETELQR